MSDQEYTKSTCGDGGCGDGGCCPSDCASCGGGCGGSSQLPSTITLTMDDDTEVTCAIITVFPVEDKEYIAVLPVDDKGHPTGMEVYLYKFARTETGDPMLDNIDSDEEYMAAAEKFNAIMEKAREDEKNNVPIE